MVRSTGSRFAVLLAIAACGVAAAAEAQQREQSTRTADGVRVIDTTAGRDLDESQKVRIRITNDLVPTRSVVVSVVGGTRPEYVLGAVLSNETKEWIIDTRSYVGGMRLVASSGSRDVRISRQIDVTSFASVRWGLSMDILRVERIPAKSDTR